MFVFYVSRIQFGWSFFLSLCFVSHEKENENENRQQTLLMHNERSKTKPRAVILWELICDTLYKQSQKEGISVLWEFSVIIDINGPKLTNCLDLVGEFVWENHINKQSLLFHFFFFKSKR